MDFADDIALLLQRLEYTRQGQLPGRSITASDTKDQQWENQGTVQQYQAGSAYHK